MKKISEVTKFIEIWKVKEKKYYEELLNLKRQMESKEYPLTEEVLKTVEVYSFKTYKFIKKYDEDKIKNILELVRLDDQTQLNRYKREVTRYFYQNWTSKYPDSLLLMLEKMYCESEMQKILDEGAIFLEKSFYSKIEKKLDGEVIKATIKLGINGELDGVVEGKNNKVRVHAIIAGGYNVQKLHYRVLVKEIK